MSVCVGSAASFSPPSQEAELHYEVQSANGAVPDQYLTGALQLREHELQQLWHACAAVAKVRSPRVPTSVARMGRVPPAVAR
jgi:hypothetical protein